MSERILLVCRIWMGRNFPNRNGFKLMISGKFDGELLDTGTDFPHGTNPKFITDLAWDFSQPNLRQHKIQASTVKLQCYAVPNAGGKHESVGYIILNIREAHYKSKTARWYPVLNSKYHALHPELYLSFFLEDGEGGEEVKEGGEEVKEGGEDMKEEQEKKKDGPEEMKERWEEGEAGLSEEEGSGSFEEQLGLVDGKSISSTPQQNIIREDGAVPHHHIKPILSDNGQYFILNLLMDEDKLEFFSFAVTLAFAENLHLLKRDGSDVTSKSYKFHYTLFGYDIESWKFDGLDSASDELQPERASIMLKSNLHILKEFFSSYPGLKIELLEGGRCIGSTKVDLTSLVPTSSHHIYLQPLSIEGRYNLTTPFNSQADDSGDVMRPCIGVIVNVRAVNMKSQPVYSPPTKLQPPTPISHPQSYKVGQDQQHQTHQPKINNYYQPLPHSPPPPSPPNKDVEDGVQANPHTHIPIGIDLMAGGDATISTTHLHNTITSQTNSLTCTTRLTRVRPLTNTIYQHVYFRYQYPLFSTSHSTCTDKFNLYGLASSAESNQTQWIQVPGGESVCDVTCTLDEMCRVIQSTPLQVYLCNGDGEVLATVTLPMTPLLDEQKILHRVMWQQSFIAEVAAISSAGQKICIVEIVLNIDNHGRTSPNENNKCSNANVTEQIQQSYSSGCRDKSNPHGEKVESEGRGRTRKVEVLEKDARDVDEKGQTRVLLSEVKESVEYKAALEIELWKQQQEDDHMKKLKQREQDLLTELKDKLHREHTDKMSEVRKQQKFVDSESIRLQKLKEEMDARAKALEDGMSELSRREGCVRREWEEKVEEVRVRSKTLQEKCLSEVEVERERRQHVEAMKLTLQQRVTELEKVLHEKFSVINQLRNRLDASSDGIDADGQINLMRIENDELKMKVQHLRQSKEYYKNQWSLALKELASAQQGSGERKHFYKVVAEQRGENEKEREMVELMREEYEMGEKDHQVTGKHKSEKVNGTLDVNNSVSKLLDERMTLLNTGCYVESDTLIESIDEQINYLLHQSHGKAAGSSSSGTISHSS